MGLSNIQTSRLPLTEDGFSCGYALARGMARHPSRPLKIAAYAMQTTTRNEVQNKKSEAIKPLTLLARPVYPGTRETSHSRA